VQHKQVNYDNTIGDPDDPEDHEATTSTLDDPEQTISTTCTPQVGEYNIRQWHRSAKSKPTRATAGDGFHSTTSPHRGSEPHVSASRKWSTRVTESQQAGCKPPPEKSLRPPQRRERRRRPHRPPYPPLITNGRARARHHNQHEPRARHHKRLEQRARQHIQHEQRARQHMQREQRARHHKRHEQHARQHIRHEPRASQTKQPSPRHINCNPHGRRHQAVSTTASTTLCTPRPDTFIFPTCWNPVHRRRQVQTHQTLRTLPLTPCHAPEASPWPSTFAPATSSKKPTTESSPTTTQPHPRIRAITKFVSDRFVWPNHSNIDATFVASTLAARCISGFGTSLRLATTRA
jgi:hypothetical protein